MKKNPTIAEDLIEGFAKLGDALEAGVDIGTMFNCYQMQLDLRPETYTPERVKGTRQQLGASQTVFARFLGVSAKSISQWERGVSRPSCTACRFMDEIRKNPAYYIRRLHESMIPKAGRRRKVV